MQKLKNIFHLFEAVVANLFFGFPSRGMTVLAVTGTDGKTTTTTLLYEMLKQAGKKVALISTVAAYIGDEEIDTGFHVTNPSSFALQKLISRMKQQNVTHLVLEVTSHGIDQNRNFGIHPEIGAITNITHEHLDYHKNFQNLLETKVKLLKMSKLAIINKDAKESYSQILKCLKQSKNPFLSVSRYSLEPRILVAAKKRFGDVSYNLENVALATAIAQKQEVDIQNIVAAIENFPGVKGRMEEVGKYKGVRVVVDFAHTPNALKEALLAVRTKLQKERSAKSRVIVVFGCAGLRDHTKRPKMGKVAAELSDLAVFTAEDPRTESVGAIIGQMKSGITRRHNRIVSIKDRYQAIRFAMEKLAESGDVVLIAGKGHERSMCYGKTEYPWSDQEAVAKVIAGEKSWNYANSIHIS